MSEQDVLEIFRVKNSNGSKEFKQRTTAATLARKYGVGPQAIRNIWNGRTWINETRQLREQCTEREREVGSEICPQEFTASMLSCQTSESCNEFFETDFGADGKAEGSRSNLIFQMPQNSQMRQEESGQRKENDYSLSLGLPSDSGIEFSNSLFEEEEVLTSSCFYHVVEGTEK